MKKISAIVIRDGDLYAPEPWGRADILTIGRRIADIGPNLSLPSWADGAIIDARGLMVFPGFVDQHVHFAGGGGEGGPQFRTPELTLSQLTRWGLTTVVGLLGTDGTTRSVQALLAKTRALVMEGLNAWMYTGAYQVPTRTITESPRSDMILIDRVIGVGEIAISDHRGSHPSDRELAQLAGEARTGGLLAGKAGVLHVHVGSGARRLDPLFKVLELADVLIGTMVPTHLNRTRDLLDDAVRYGRLGGFLDVTSSIAPDAHDHQAVSPVEAVRTLRAAGIPLEKISFSTDAGGSAPVFDEAGHVVHLGMGLPNTLFEAIRDLREQLGLSWSDAIKPATQTPAAILKFPDVGHIQPGCRGDLVVTDGREIIAVVANGRVMVKEGRPVVFSSFEARAQ